MADFYVARSRIEGRGCFAATPFVKGKKVGELAGQRIARSTARRRMRGKQRIRICDVDEQTSIDASRGGDASAFINHSCDPNLFMRTVRGHVLFFARHDIARGDELTVDYGDSHHDGRRRCRCGAANCRGNI